MDVNVESMDARTLLAVALKCNQIFMARLLIVAGEIDVNKPFASGTTVLEMIVNFEYFDMTDMLLETERKINLFNCQEQTLLQMVVGYN